MHRYALISYLCVYSEKSVPKKLTVITQNRYWELMRKFPWSYNTASRTRHHFDRRRRWWDHYQPRGFFTLVCAPFDLTAHYWYLQRQRDIEGLATHNSPLKLDELIGRLITEPAMVKIVVFVTQAKISHINAFLLEALRGWPRIETHPFRIASRFRQPYVISVCVGFYHFPQIFANFKEFEPFSNS